MQQLFIMSLCMVLAQAAFAQQAPSLPQDIRSLKPHRPPVTADPQPPVMYTRQAPSGMLPNEQQYQASLKVISAQTDAIKAQADAIKALSVRMDELEAMMRALAHADKKGGK
ncbi:hypothetical protein GJA_3062 [Janthinobacterium agaricidamnosum NBRC 102515 = DSM 9628]|uniref:Uncharacterized protein n=2 Tax=Janthinobacterium agaricidamnosum TaxID=55508 RepID=W0V8L0_9BURK|nr:hypothetical protein [Janthinobacterium agaricidamnosum]CDG83688.1 hypothetical protein GJA_3062 [Janthinobacterium agaricidamnosum NBRC 102515 = DSM 9628]